MPSRALIAVIGIRQRARATTIHQGTIDLVRIDGNGSSASERETGLTHPISAISLPTSPARALFGPVVSATLDRQQIVVAANTASTYRIAIGDTLEFAPWKPTLPTLRITVGAVVDSALAGGAEVVLPERAAATMGFARPRNVVVWGFSPPRRDALARALDRFAGETFVDRSWTKPSVDSVLSQAEVKTVLGAFAVARRGRAISVDPQWERQNIVDAELPIIGKVRCHRVIVPALQSALLEIEQGGMAAAIDVRDTQRAGGCFSSRLIRSETGAAGRNLSRHSWAGAIDINPSSNAFGAVPQISPVVVEVFRRHGFAWGGTWDEPDGMHFEFVGKARVSGPRLPIVPTTTSTTTTSTTTTTTTTLASTTTTTTVASTTTRSALPAAIPEPAVVTTSIHVPTSSTGLVGASTTSAPVRDPDPAVGSTFRALESEWTMETAS